MPSSLVLSEALSIPNKINHFSLNDKNNYLEISNLISEKKIDYVVTVARGTSDCAALYLSYMFAKYLGLPTYSMPPSIITLEESKFDFSRALVFIISQSGKSEDLVECHKMVKNMGAKTILISNNLNSPIIKTSNYFFDINAGEEKSVAATKTFVLSLLIILKLVFSTLNNKDINKHIEKLSDHLILDSKNHAKNYFNEARQKIFSNVILDNLDNQNQWNPNILDKTISNGYIISRGVGYAISNEISLKFKELCQEMIEPFSSAEVMHGPKSLIENSFKLFTISLRDKSGMIVAKDSNQIISLTNLHYEITYDENSNTKLRYNTNEMIELDPIIVLSKFYPWIVNYSFEKGLDPDNPRYLTKVTQTF